MDDRAATFDDLRDELRAFVLERDWEQFHNPKDLAIALSIEASELLERFLWQSPQDAVRTATDRRATADELADVMIYALHLANVLDIDVSATIRRKIAKNRRKYPASKFKGRAR